MKHTIGGESGPSQDMISQLLEDAMASDLELSGVDTEQRFSVCVVICCAVCVCVCVCARAHTCVC